MSLPLSNLTSRSELRNQIRRLATRYSDDEAFCCRLIERTILVLIDNPDVLDDAPIDRAIFQVLHRLASAELKAEETPGRTGVSRSPRMRTTVTFQSSEITRSHFGTSALSGSRYLVVEDEYFVASTMLRVLEKAGAKVLGPVSDIDRALEVTRDESLEIDAAILDINLHGQTVYPAARLLAKRGTPFLFVTGRDHTDVPDDLAGALCLGKPCEDATLVEALLNMRNLAARGSANAAKA